MLTYDIDIDTSGFSKFTELAGNADGWASGQQLEERIPMAAVSL